MSTPTFIYPEPIQRLARRLSSEPLLEYEDLCEIINNEIGDELKGEESFDGYEADKLRASMEDQ